MRKGVISVVALTVALMFVPAVYAYLPGYGPQKGTVCDVDPAKVKKFHKETVSLRDQLVTKKLELRREFARKHPDRVRIASIQKEIVEIRAKIMKMADAAGMPGSLCRFRGCSWSQGIGIINKHVTPALL